MYRSKSSHEITRAKESCSGKIIEGRMFCMLMMYSNWKELRMILMLIGIEVSLQPMSYSITDR